MLILTIDSDLKILDEEVRLIREKLPEAAVVGFTTYSETVNFVKQSNCDLVFLEAELKDGSGLALAKEITSIHPETRIIFVTEHGEHAAEAFRLHAEGYIIKPLTESRLLEEMELIGSIEKGKKENADPEKHSCKHILRIQTFGNFECFVDDKPIIFKYYKAKELLAYLVDRKGAMCTNGELMSVLWADESGNKDSYFRNIKSDLIGTLRKHGFEDVIVKQKGAIGLNTDKVMCDYYDVLEGNKPIEGNYWGEYISQYSWAEVTNAFLSNYYNIRRKS